MFLVENLVANISMAEQEHLVGFSNIAYRDLGKYSSAISCTFLLYSHDALPHGNPSASSWLPEADVACTFCQMFEKHCLRKAKNEQARCSSESWCSWCSRLKQQERVCCW